MEILVLNPKKTHEGNPDCPSRLVPAPDGRWMCIDCGRYIVQEHVGISVTCQKNKALGWNISEEIEIVLFPEDRKVVDILHAQMFGKDNKK